MNTEEFEIAVMVNGNVVISESIEDAPVMKIEFIGEAKELADEEKIRVGKAALSQARHFLK